ncbi:MAG: TlpA disulfide reductase family protein [Candidatus Kapabacteria bacterium]|nr:TlpA disulfide reductase family protein [Candidatus Kapabacteria bacterium]
MKFQNLFFLIALVLVILFTYTLSQNRVFPSIRIKKLTGEIVDTRNFGNNGNPFLIVFFGTCCNPSLKAMSEISENYKIWQNKYKLKIIAICIDDSRNSKKVAPLAKSNGWMFDIFLDENSDFKREMNVSDKPHFTLFDGKGKILYQKAGYMPGLGNEIKKVLEEIPQ